MFLVGSELGMGYGSVLYCLGWNVCKTYKDRSCGLGFGHVVVMYVMLCVALFDIRVVIFIAIGINCCSPLSIGKERQYDELNDM